MDHRHAGLADYRPAFEDADEEFLIHYAVDEDGRIARRRWRRGEFWHAARQAAAVLRDAGLARGDRFCLCMGANQPLDLVFRLGAVMTGTVPVTVNWQADDAERIAYKIGLSGSRLLVTDGLFDRRRLADARRLAGGVPAAGPETLAAAAPLSEEHLVARLPAEATRLVVFTSGTTGRPKGVALSYRAYRTNRATFEDFLALGEGQRLAVLIVNPLHHANSSAVTDWAMRRPGSRVHLLSRYTTAYWRILAEVADGEPGRIVAPAVSRHFDFLASLEGEGRLPLAADRLRAAMARVDFLVGSAPVGPTTIRRLLHWAGRIPAVRFGATETCLQALGIPAALPEAAKQAAFERGWRHRHAGAPLIGYYIGRPHPPHTEAAIVAGLSPGEPGFMQPCPPGVPGYLVVRGQNLMSGYLGPPEQTQAVFHEGWYTGLRDVGFTLTSDHDGRADFYWVSRESTLMIRGGANYAYEQINEEIRAAIAEHYGLEPEEFDVAVVGLRVASEHEDACCATVERRGPAAERRLPAQPEALKAALNRTLSKGARVDHLRYAPVPRSFKGAVQVKALAAEFERHLSRGR